MKNIKFEDVRKIKNELKKVKPKPQAKQSGHKLNLKGVIYELAPELDKMRANGYCYAELVEILKQHNVQIGVQTLSKYLSDFRKGAAPAPVEPPAMVAEKMEQRPLEAEPDHDGIQHNNTPDINDWVYGNKNN